MYEEELKKLSKESLVKIINGELVAIEHLIAKQQESVDTLDQSPTRSLNMYCSETGRLSGYKVARDLLTKFINEEKEKK